MFIKKIVCTVEVMDREAFDKAQRQWTPLSQVPGFLAQVGGWRGRDAVIFAFWESKEAYESFMEDVHDEIFNQNLQKNTYNSISITLWQTNKPSILLMQALSETRSISINQTDQSLLIMVASAVHSKENLYLSFLPNEKGELKLYHPWIVFSSK
ncbi:YdbC family protein [Pontibacillus sp. HMF3514]|uniref:YdbC family protein n=1 Tax=Pontibacillus sp. HMF3514 TaxID=2692425 RepID=UPI00131FCD3B|nr:YdbC family protein [Pontibacillus sp. HMF3514]QHE51293.1 DUF4937 domain-containing protein [Pontibacillus sp. HMF3514]